MPAYTFFSSRIGDVGEILLPESEEQRHLKVMRMRQGDQARFINGQGVEAIASLEDPGEGVWKILQRNASRQPPERRIMIPFMRGAKLDWILEKVVELGVNSIQLFPAEKSEPSEPKLERLQKIIRSAVKQCGTVWEPTLSTVGPICRWTELECPLPLFFGSLRPGSRRLPGVLLPPHWIWCAGPEAGWAEEEERHLIDLGATAVRLCENILRAETAAISGVACLVALQANDQREAQST
jgi:16S rRNA (uracil1498-N3)-methyltransferase